MTRRPCTCRYCATPAVVEDRTEREPIQLPAVPTPIRVHQPGRPPFDCTLHPDGTLTAVLGGEHRQNCFTFAEMRERNWAGAHIELDPPPLPETTGPEPAGGVVQEALIG